MDSRPDTEDRELIPSIPTHSSTPASLRCCCGRQDCVLLEHNNVALEGLEKDLATAARLGQVRKYPFSYASSLLLCGGSDRRSGCDERAEAACLIPHFCHS